MSSFDDILRAARQARSRLSPSQVSTYEERVCSRIDLLQHVLVRTGDGNLQFADDMRETARQAVEQIARVSDLDDPVAAADYGLLLVHLLLQAQSDRNLHGTGALGCVREQLDWTTTMPSTPPPPPPPREPVARARPPAIRTVAVPTPAQAETTLSTGRSTTDADELAAIRVILERMQRQQDAILARIDQLSATNRLAQPDVATSAPVVKDDDDTVPEKHSDLDIEAPQDHTDCACETIGGSLAREWPDCCDAERDDWHRFEHRVGQAHRTFCDYVDTRARTLQRRGICDLCDLERWRSVDSRPTLHDGGWGPYPSSSYYACL